MTQTPIPHSKEMPAPFPRWLPLIGIVFGLIYLAILGLTKDMFGETPANVNFTISKLAYTGPASEIRCSLVNGPAEAVNKLPVLSANGSTPDLYAIKFPNAPARMVLALGTVPDVVAFVPCNEGQRLGNILYAGDSVAFSKRTIQTSRVAFPVDNATPDQTYLLHIVQSGAKSIPIQAIERDDFMASYERSLRVHVGFISVLAFMILYNFALAGLTQLHAFAFNALTVGSALFLNLYLTGFGPAYLWPETPELSNMVLVLAIAGTTMFTPFFIYQFVVPPDRPLLRAMPALLAWPAISAFLVILSFVVPYYYIVPPLVTLLIALLVISTVHLIRSARLGNPLSAVMLVVLLGAIMPALGVGIAREYIGYSFGAMAPHLTEMALLLEAFLFTLALAYQIKLSKWRELETLHTLNVQAELAKKHLLETIDNDRTRLASDLHDSAGQMLGLIASRLKKTIQNGDMNEIHLDDLRQTTGLATAALTDIRDMSHDLHPATLTHLGLEKAILSLCQNMSHIGGTRFTAELKFDETLLTPHQSLQIYRILQEMMTNTARHSGASDALLTLTSNKNRFHLQFSDNGLHTETSPDKVGIGRVILAQRVTSLEGQLTIKTGNLGTTMMIDFNTSLTHVNNQEF